jgi:hypothetical protein
MYISLELQADSRSSLLSGLEHEESCSTTLCTVIQQTNKQKIAKPSKVAVGLWLF